MENELKITKNTAICAGLWRAEGDNKSKAEITFTNNCFELVKIFDRTIRQLFSEYTFNVRTYVYSSDEKNIKVSIGEGMIKKYIDKRARKPYFIWRLANVKLNKKWEKIVKEIEQNPSYYADFLTGFFAGEGNIKFTTHKHRSLRIAQKDESETISKMLRYYNINFSFRKKDRSYCISHKDNWDIFAKLGLASLHPTKRKQFSKAYDSYKQKHYRRGYLKDEILKLLDKPHTSKELANKFERSYARIQDILIELKKEKVVTNFRVYSKDHWIKTSKKCIIILSLKQQYLKALNIHKSTNEIAGKFKVCWKSAFNRLKELEKLDLIVRENKIWKLKPSKIKVIIK